MTLVERNPASRRTFLAGMVGLALAGSACRSSAGPVAGPSPAAAAPTVASLTAADPFYIAHRGGGGNWPEMTAHAYEQATRIPGLQALEISVVLSADGVLVCHHDPTTTRVTGVATTIADETWADLSRLQVSAADTTDPEQSPQPVARLDDILERYIDRFVLFIEPKVKPAEAPLLARLTGLLAPERIVWKQPLVARGFRAAADAGFTTWGYVLDDPSFLGANLTRLGSAREIDMLGIPVHGRPALVKAAADTAAAAGKKTIAWAITTEGERKRALSFGASGLMTSNVLGLVPGASAASG